MPVISIKNLSLQYPGQATPALKDINLDIDEGEFVVLSGSSGCGKSSLLRCLNGIIPNLLPAEIIGDIKLQDQSLKDMTPQIISSRLGSVFQDPRSQFFHIDVLDEIAFGPENMGYTKAEIRKRVDEAIQLFGLHHLIERRMFDLSSGEKQKVIFAAVYAMGPGIFILDEPSSNLDVAAIEELRNILSFLKKMGRTIVMVEHRLYYLSGLYDRLLIMDDGQIAMEACDELQITQEEKERFGLRNLQTPTIPACDAAKRNPPRPAGKTVELENLGFRYPRRPTPALRDVSTRFLPGTVTAVVGPNGSGKTTLIKILGGLLREHSGRICLSGHPFSPSDRLKYCGFVMQESGHQLFFPNVREEIASGFIHSPTDGEVDLLLEAMNLGEKAAAHPQTLSGGQQQRLVIGTALAASPDLLILDEPTSGLDAGHMRRLAKLLKEQAGKGTSVVIVTHDLEFILNCCDRYLMIRDGILVSEGNVFAPDHAFLNFFNAGSRVD